MAQWWEDYDPAVDEDWEDAETNEDPFADPDPAGEQETDEAD